MLERFILGAVLGLVLLAAAIGLYVLGFMVSYVLR